MNNPLYRQHCIVAMLNLFNLLPEISAKNIILWLDLLEGEKDIPHLKSLVAAVGSSAIIDFIKSDFINYNVGHLNLGTIADAASPITMLGPLGPDPLTAYRWNRWIFILFAMKFPDKVEQSDWRDELFSRTPYFRVTGL